jgi:hypothetical protein
MKMFKLHFFKGIQKECIKSSNWFQTFCATKTCPLLWMYMFIEWTWWKTKSYKNFKVLKFWRKGLEGKGFIVLTIWQKNMFNGFKISSFRCRSHLHEIILPKKCFVVHWNSFWEFLGVFGFMAINQHIETHLCMNVTINTWIVLNWTIRFFLFKICFK